MRENSRRGAPRQARGAGRVGAARDPRARGSGSAGMAPGGTRPGTAARPGPGNRGGGQPAVDTAWLTSLIEPVLAAMNVDLEAVKVAAAGRRRVLRVIVDADGGVSLDEIAEVSRELSARLDAKNAMGDAPYTLEVSSPGIDRPLTQPRHWRRAVGRLVVVPLTVRDQDSQHTAPGAAHAEAARVIDADQDGVTLELDGRTLTVSYAELGPGRVQVEFARLDEADLDELGDADEDGADDDGADEEGPDGH